jgi:hypothetical protein
MPDLYNNENFKLAKNSVINVITHKKRPNYENLFKFSSAFIQMQKGNIKGAADLVYFPGWGENEDTYLKIRNRIKVIS